MPSPASSLCARFIKSLIQLPTLLFNSWTWQWNSDGSATSDFKQTVNYIQPGDFIYSASPLVPAPTPGARLPCNGGQYASTQYSALYTAIGQTYAPFNGATAENPTGDGTQIAPVPDGQGGWIFYVPNVQGRSLAAVGTSTDSNAATTTLTIGELFGEASHSLTTPEMPPHTHSYQRIDGSSGSPFVGSGSNDGFDTVQTGSTGGDSTPTVVAHNCWHPVFGAYLYIQS